MTSAPAISFEVRVALIVAWVMAFITVLALTAIGLSGLTLGLQMLLMLASVIGAVLTIASYLRPPIRHVLWRSDGGCHLQLREGSSVEADMRAARVLGAWVFLRFTWASRKTATVWLLGANSSGDVRRRLRVRIAAQSTTDAETI